MWKYWGRMKGGTPSCIIVTIPQAHLHLALYVRLEERDDIKTPALRAGIKNHTHKNIFTAFLHASKIKFTAKKHCSPFSSDSYTGRIALPLSTSFLQSRFIFKSITLRVSSARSRSKFKQLYKRARASFHT